MLKLSSLAALAACATIAFVTPAAAETSFSIPEASDQAQEQGFSPELRQAIAQGAGISISEVDSFVEKQKDRIDLVERLQTKYPESLSGVWMDDDQTLHVTATKQEVLDDAKDLVPYVRTNIVKYSYEDLLRIQDRVGQYLKESGSEEGSIVGVNSTTNKVELTYGSSNGGLVTKSAAYSTYAPTDTSKGVSTALGEMADAIDLVPKSTESVPLDCGNGWDCFPYLRGGMFIRLPGGDCTAGFVARNRKGEKYILTAGHCGYRGASVYTGANQQRTPVGVMTNTTNNSRSDSARVFVSDPAWKVTRWVRMDPGRQAMSITGKLGQRFSKNQLVCKSGMKTGLTCGKVTDESIDFTIDGINRKGFWRSNLFSQRGDSGAPVYVPYNAAKNASKAYGLISSGNQKTHTDGPGIFAVEGAENVTVVTR